MQDAEHRHRAVRRRLAREIAADDANAAVILIEPLVRRDGSSASRWRLADPKIAAADHLVDLKIDGAQVALARRVWPTASLGAALRNARPSAQAPSQARRRQPILVSESDS